jgi:ATP-dependent Lhr-like helicase
MTHLDPQSRPGGAIFKDWFAQKGWNPFAFQLEAWAAQQNGQDGFLTAPTGSGKTLAMLGGLFLSQLERQHKGQPSPQGPELLWITPLRALAKDLEASMQEMIHELGLSLTVGRRTGDVSSNQKAKQRQNMPSILITTPESLHILFASARSVSGLKHVERVVVDEWHEFMGSKRGTQCELVLSRLRALKPSLNCWGVSATIGNVEEAKHVLFGSEAQAKQAVHITGDHPKEIDMISVVPESIDELPWSGHLGLSMIEQVLPYLEPPGSVLLFTNTRAQAELWFRGLLEAKPDLAGDIALHHGSLTQHIRLWVEGAIKEGIIRIVVCTSSLDLGVDFSPVDRVIQVGSPKGIARFMQRAGRSGHAPGQKSTLIFVPTHALELIEAGALRESIYNPALEDRVPPFAPMDVLSQYAVTRAVGGGVYPNELYQEVVSTWSYQSLTNAQWDRVLFNLIHGGDALQKYPEFQKLVLDADGLIKPANRRVSTRHRLSIGTISSDAMLRVRFITGGFLGTVEEWFIAKLEPGDCFWFAGRNLELVRVKQMTVYVRRAKGASKSIPSWLGGRMSLSSNLSSGLQRVLNDLERGQFNTPETRAIRPLMELQAERSALPSHDRFLVELSQSKEGYHAFFFPFEGRAVHEGLSTLIATRIADQQSITFTLAMNDYGFELLTDQPLPWSEAWIRELFTPTSLVRDLQRSVNTSELAKRHFRYIARISGMVFQGYPGKTTSTKHLQVSSGLLYDVLSEYEPDHLLLQQAQDEVLQTQLEESRIREVLHRIQSQPIHMAKTPRFSPFAFPIFVDRLRGKVSSETLTQRIQKMQDQAKHDLQRHKEAHL